MKKLVLTLTLTLACAAAFAQGKVRLINDSTRLVYFTTDTTKLLPGDQAGASTPAGGVTLSGQTLEVDLWGGTSASTLTKQGSTTMSAAADGTISGDNILASFPGGSSEFFQVQVYSLSAGSYAAASAGQNLYFGESSIFNVTPGTGVQYAAITQTTSIAFSTWTAGSQPISGSAYGAGATGAIAIMANVPEPTSMALLGLGSAAMLIFRRRK